MLFKAPNQSSILNWDIQADTFPVGLQETYQTLCKNLEDAQSSQTKYSGGNEVVIQVGDKIWLSSRQFRTTIL